MRNIGFSKSSFSMKSLGFGASAPEAVPTVVANFVADTYTQDDQPASFNDVLSLDRDSLAWLVVNNTLQEYAINTPRITGDGLLVEDSSTNYVNYSFLPAEDNYTDGGVAFIDGFWRKTSSSTGYLYPRATALNEPAILSVYSIGESAFTRVVASNVLNDMLASMPLSTVQLEGIDSRNAGLSWESGSVSSAPVPLYWQIEKGSVATSPIKTTTSPVTRAKDVLTSKNPVQSVTGDWDQTLSVSITDGQLVTSGRGYIRSMTIN